MADLRPMPTAIVAEDEALLRQSLVELLQRAWPELEIVAECDDGAGALEAIEQHRPGVAFLDIRMPGLTGMDVAAAAIEASPATRIVFITAYDQYAVEAFEHGAVDYLLKPVDPERLDATVRRLQSPPGPGLDAALLDALAARMKGVALAPAEPLTWITASAGRETRLILVDDVIYFRADHKYTVVVTAEGEALIRKPIRDLLEVLDPTVFKQVHRSTIVNLRAIAAIVRDDSGRGTLRLRNREETLPVSAPFMTLFRHM
nr:LytTR family DNA-binding domain-containing protein [Lysobacter alkalisoli]